jgi:hypothetical protein
MTIPAIQADGMRHTVNYQLTPAQTTWNLRSALNVAALNCLEPKYDPILQSYKGLLKIHARGLSSANRTLESEFRQKYGPGFRDVLDGYMTQVYNYFALPPARNSFCEASLGVAQELPLVAQGDLDAFAARSLPRIEGVFDDFFRAYEQYRVEVARWDAEYNPTVLTATVAGYVNPLDPAVNIPPGSTAVGTMPALPPSSAPAPEPVIVLTQPAPTAAPASPAAGAPVIVQTQDGDELPTIQLPLGSSN